MATFNFSATNDEAAAFLGVLTGLGAYVVGHSALLDAVYAGIVAGAGVLGYTGYTSAPAAAPKAA